MNFTVLAAWLAGTVPNRLQANSAIAPIADLKMNRFLIEISFYVGPSSLRDHSVENITE
jgi:hypothetical protein